MKYKLGTKIRVISGGRGDKECYHYYINGDIVLVIGYDGDYICERISDKLVQRILLEDLETI